MSFASKKHSVARPRNCFRAEQTSHVVSWDVEGQKTLQEAKDLTKPGISDLGLKGIKGRHWTERVVGQTSNFICKASLLAVVASVILFRENKDLSNRSKLIKEGTHYDKQWRSSWQDEKGNNMSNPDQGPQ
ncbi:hypothetical protein ACLOJK_030436 [Asimina triloba]